MIKIKKIEFIKVVYEGVWSHNIFSIANIHFSNYPSIYGALLYWKKNDSPLAYTNDGDYKFFYDLLNTTHFAAVKFPRNVNLTRDQKQELAYILLNERGVIGTYSFQTHTNKRKPFNKKKVLKKIDFPKNFDPKSIPPYIGPDIDENGIKDIQLKNPSLSKEFIEEYCLWRHNVIKLHPEQFEPYLPYIDFSYICFSCNLLSEQYLIDHLDDIDFVSLQCNLTVIKNLSASFQEYIDLQFLKQQSINSFFECQIDKLLQDVENNPPHITSEQNETNKFEEEDESIEFQFFEYDRGKYKWPGSEHLVKGIPSLASQMYDELGYKKCTNKEMDQKINNYSEIQLQLVSAILEPHWLHRYRNQLNWKHICKYNKYLTDDFLMHMKGYIDFEALGNNLWCTLSTDFLSKNMNRFNHSQPVPLIIHHLTEELYLKYKHIIKITEGDLYKYYPNFGDEQYFRLLDLISE